MQVLPGRIFFNNSKISCNLEGTFWYVLQQFEFSTCRNHKTLSHKKYLRKNDRVDIYVKTVCKSWIAIFRPQKSRDRDAYIVIVFRMSKYQDPAIV